MTEHDPTWLERALLLAERGRGYVEPNPLVGAVLVKNGKVVGEGWHKRFGEGHAEINALAQAGEAARNATLYVTLEPCCHTGKTPPCTEAIIRAGINRVVAAIEDPFAQVAGQGIARLRSAGIAVDVGVCEKQARRLNAPYLTLLSGRPYVHGKWAMTLDGKIASRTGESKWISGSEARQHVHELRGRMDAIVIGIGTALADDPLLTARALKEAPPRRACRIVLDSTGRLPPNSFLAITARETPTMIVTGGPLSPERAGLFTGLGCEILSLPGSSTRPDVKALLDEFAKRRWTNILVEGGAQVLGSFLDAGAIDEVHVFIAPRLVGGELAKSPIGGLGFASLSDALALSDWTMARIGTDVLIHGWRE